MNVTTLGDGDPEVAIVVAIHGDEPAGVRAIDRLTDGEPTLQRPVKLIVANVEALERDVRFVDEDLNRAFPGDRNGETHESRLAARLTVELDGCTTLSIHSTQSHGEPFAVAHQLVDPIRTILPRLPVTAVVETGDFVQGRLFESVDRLVEVEAGLQGTDQAAANADRLARAFLTATGVLPGGAPPRELPVFRLTGQVSKAPADQYEIFVENFERVAAGEAFAAADGVEQVAESSFSKREQREYHGPPCPWVKRVTTRTFNNSRIILKSSAVVQTHPHFVVRIRHAHGEWRRPAKRLHRIPPHPERDKPSRQARVGMGRYQINGC